MNPNVADFYSVPNIQEMEDISLQQLREVCLTLEDRLRYVIEDLPDSQRCVVEAYLDARDELEFQTVKAALRWGKLHYK